MASTNSTSRTGYVYFVSAGTNLVKIGRSIDPFSRIKSLQQHTRLPLTLIHAIYTNDASWLEAKLHRHFIREHLFGEWFRIRDEWLIDIRTCLYHDRLELLEPTQPLTDAAKMLGRRGGQKGGNARAAVLSPERRREIASMGGKARAAKRVKGGKA